MNLTTVRRFITRSAAVLAAVTGLPQAAQTLPASVASAASAPAVPEYKLKAAFVYNFVLFTEWPTAGGDNGPLNLCVNAESMLRPALAEFHDRTVKGRRLQIRNLNEAENLSSCHVLVLDSIDRERWAQIRRQLGGAAVLTVADDAEIGRRGAVITLYLENNRIAFDVDMNAARAAHLTLSSKLLRLARIMP
jgi:phosphohistidine swiveling domain-containing protein